MSPKFRKSSACTKPFWNTVEAVSYPLKVIHRLSRGLDRMERATLGVGTLATATLHEDTEHGD